MMPRGKGFPAMVRNVAKRIAARATRLLRWAAVRRLVRREDGSVAIEFAFVAMPFFALLVATIETSLIFFAGQTLETAVADSARMIMTLQAQNQNFDYTAFKSQICSRIHALFDCANGIQLDVNTASSFSGANTSNPLDANGNLTITQSYNPGGPGDIVVVRVVYKWPVWAQFFGINLINMAGNSRLLMSTAVFRNEP
jgi:Flp pilus assembly protein TadG